MSPERIKKKKSSVSISNNTMPDLKGSAPAGSPEVNLDTTCSKRCANPMPVDFDLETPHGHGIFKNKTRGLSKDKKFDVTTKDAAAIRKFLLGKQGALGGVIPKVPIAYKGVGSVKGKQPNVPP